MLKKLNVGFKDTILFEIIVEKIFIIVRKNFHNYKNFLRQKNLQTPPEYIKQ